MAKFISALILLIALGAAGAYVYVKYVQTPQQLTRDSADAADHAGHEAGAPAEDSHEVTEHAGAVHLHGGAAAGGEVALCAKHHIPLAVCAFCDLSLKEKLGFCKGHDVAEALCTRCSPILIPAFKIEGDWCEEHGLPESQCKICAGDKATP